MRIAKSLLENSWVFEANTLYIAGNLLNCDIIDT